MDTNDLSSRALELLAKSRLFSRFATEEIDQLLGYLVSFEVGAGKTLMREGDKGNYLAVVVEGELQALKTSSDDQQVIIGTLKRGWIIGEMAIVDGEPRSATIRATRESTVVVLTRENLERMKEAHPTMSIILLEEIARELSLKLRRMSEFAADIQG
jgi:CRP-like cAMP-binding protein